MPRGLSKKTTGLKAIRWLAVIGLLGTCVGQLVLLGSEQPPSVLLIHSMTVILIALSSYCWVLLPVGLSTAFSVVVFVITMWALSRTQAIVLWASVPLSSASSFARWAA